jgi:hypothetical protein
MHILKFALIQAVLAMPTMAAEVLLRRQDHRELEKQVKYWICKIPPGNPDNFHTIEVAEAALPAQLATGSLSGPCDDMCDML